MGELKQAEKVYIEGVRIFKKAGSLVLNSVGEVLPGKLDDYFPVTQKPAESPRKKSKSDVSYLSMKIFTAY